MIKVITFLAVAAIVFGAVGIDSEGLVPAICCMAGLAWCFLLIVAKWDAIARINNKDWRK